MGIVYLINGGLSFLTFISKSGPDFPSDFIDFVVYIEFSNIGLMFSTSLHVKYVPHNLKTESKEDIGFHTQDYD